MRSFRTVCFCASYNLKRWRRDWRVILFVCVIAAFALFDLRDLSTFAKEYDMTISAWVASAFFTPRYMVTLFALLLGIIFSDAPFYYEHSQFVIARAGRLEWILGQTLYIVIASFVLTALVWIASWIAFLPNISFENDWGTIAKTVALNSGVPANISVRIYLPSVLSEFSPVGTAVLSFLLMWLTAVFVGTLFMFFTSFFGKTISVSVFGFLLFMSFTATVTGIFTFGEKVSYFAPLSFCNIYGTARFSGNPNLPPLAYCLTVLSSLSVIFITLTSILFCKQDLAGGKDDK